MDTQTTPEQPAQKSYVVLPPEIAVEPAPFFSAKFILFTVVMMTAAVALGSHGKIPFNPFSKTAAPNAQAQASGPMAAIAALTGKPAPSAPPVPPLNPASFIVTSISLGQPSFAIINGTSCTVGDAVAAPGVTGWKVESIMDGTVVLQNGASFANLQLTTPGIKPLDDDLHPLN
jgi:hypothetical protein